MRGLKKNRMGRGQTSKRQHTDIATTRPTRPCIGPTIRIGREILCLPYAGFFLVILNLEGHQNRVIGSKVMVILLNGGI